MRTSLTIDSGGRVVLPKAVRDELGLRVGDTLDFVVHGDEVTLRPRRSSTPLQKERGVWVFRTGTTLTTEEVNQALKDVRARRDRSGDNR